MPPPPLPPRLPPDPTSPLLTTTLEIPIFALVSVGLVLLLTLGVLLQRLHQLTKALTTTHEARHGGPRRRDDGADDGADDGDAPLLPACCLLATN